MSKVPNYYKIPSGIDEDVCDLILNKFKNTELVNSSIGISDSLIEDESWRKSKHCWIDTDHWVSGMMAHFVNCANVNYFNYDISHWSTKIQYTVYDSKNSHYDWHTDTCQCEYNPNFVRKLSISLVLSSKNDYIGGEFEIMKNPREILDLKLDIGDVVVFSSDTIHRVKPVTKGKRVSLVGWFSGPKFK